MMTNRKRFVISAAIGAVLGTGIGTLYILAAWAQVAEHGSTRFANLSLGLTLLLLGALLVALPCPILLLFRKTRLWAGLVLLTAVTTFMAAISLMPFAGAVRMAAFHKLESRSAPLVNAITAYTTSQGGPPLTLEALVPTYLSEIPTTGIGAYPTYTLVSGDDAKGWNENPWALYVETPLGFLNFDMFIYLPNQNYPEEGYGGSLERIGTWAYVHE